MGYYKKTPLQLKIHTHRLASHPKHHTDIQNEGFHSFERSGCCQRCTNCCSVCRPCWTPICWVCWICWLPLCRRSSIRWTRWLSICCWFRRPSCCCPSKG